MENPYKHLDDVNKNIADSILSTCDKSSALDSENSDKDSLEVSFLSDDGTIQDLKFSLLTVWHHSMNL